MAGCRQQKTPRCILMYIRVWSNVATYDDCQSLAITKQYLMFLAGPGRHGDEHLHTQVPAPWGRGPHLGGLIAGHRRGVDRQGPEVPRQARAPADVPHGDQDLERSHCHALPSCLVFLFSFTPPPWFLMSILALFLVTVSCIFKYFFPLIQLFVSVI